MTEELMNNKEARNDEVVVFKGKYITAIGRRKTAIAIVRMYQNGKGAIMVNNKKISLYFPANILPIATYPLKLSGHMKDLNFSIKVSGGGIKGQADAVKHGITRTLTKLNEELKPALKAKGLITRDSRKKERKKPGLKKARRAPQWSKR